MQGRHTRRSFESKATTLRTAHTETLPPPPRPTQCELSEWLYATKLLLIHPPNALLSPLFFFPSSSHSSVVVGIKYSIGQTGQMAFSGSREREKGGVVERTEQAGNSAYRKSVAHNQARTRGFLRLFPSFCATYFAVLYTAQHPRAPA